MIDIKITLFYTDACNIACEHCFIDESHRTNKKMSSESLKAILCYADRANVSVISISGGEAMLFYDGFKDLLHVNKKYKTTISTNGFWGFSLAQAIDMCIDFQSHGIDQIEISTDIYHQKYIPMDYIKNIIQAADQIGLAYKVIMCIDSDIKNILESNHFRKLVTITKGIENIVIQHVANYGKAKMNQLNTNLLCDDFAKQKCRQIMNPCIDYDGNVFACCGPHLTLKDTSPFYFGNIKMEPIGQIIDRIVTDKRLQEIMHLGPFIYYKNNVIEVEEGTSLCDYCIKSMKIKNKELPI